MNSTSRVDEEVINNQALFLRRRIHPIEWDNPDLMLFAWERIMNVGIQTTKDIKKS